MGKILNIINVHHVWPEHHKFLVQLSMLSRLSHPTSPTTLLRGNLLVLFERVRLRGGNTAREATIDLATLTDGLGELLEGRHGGVPVDACISDGDALLEGRGTLSGNLLVSLIDV